MQLQLNFYVAKTLYADDKLRENLQRKLGHSCHVGVQLQEGSKSKTEAIRQALTIHYEDAESDNIIFHIECQYLSLKNSAAWKCHGVLSDKLKDDPVIVARIRMLWVHFSQFEKTFLRC